jgi:hypothetical protein
VAVGERVGGFVVDPGGAVTTVRGGGAVGAWVGETVVGLCVGERVVGAGLGAPVGDRLGAKVGGK